MLRMISLWIIFNLLSISLAYMIHKPKGNYEKIVMDVDAGVDDALAIHIITKNEKYFHGPPLIAITCVAGNTNLKNVKTNVLRTLQQLQRTNIPVYVGSSEPLFYRKPVEDSFYGMDGFGDIPHDPNTLGKVQREHAVTALIRLASSNPGQITLIATGPLTNVALALKLDPGFLNKLKKLVIIGGSVFGIGNIEPGIEFNFMKDPEAVHVVLDHSNYKKVTLFPWDTVVLTNLTKDWRVNKLGALNNEDMKFINEVEAVSLNKSDSWHSADSMGAATCIWPITIAEKPLRVSTVSCGEARGGLLVDHYRAHLNVSTSNVNVVTGVDGEKFKDLLYAIYDKKY